MARRLLWVTIENIELFSNGEVPGAKLAAGEEKRNAVIASLTYPRSGAPSVVSALQFTVPEKTAFTPDQTDFFASGLFKEEVQEETLLQIKVTDTDQASKVGIFVLTLLTSLAGAALGTATGGISKVLGAVVTAGVDRVQNGIPKLAAGDQVFVIGETPKLKLKIDTIPADSGQPLRMNLPLMVEEEVRKPYFEMDGGQAVAKELVLPKGTNNGHIIIRLWATEL